MTKEQKDKILKALAEDRNDYAKDCQERIAKEHGKIIGADYMIQRFLDVIRTLEGHYKDVKKSTTCHTTRACTRQDKSRDMGFAIW